MLTACPTTWEIYRGEFLFDSLIKFYYQINFYTIKGSANSFNLM